MLPASPWASLCKVAEAVAGGPCPGPGTPTVARHFPLSLHGHDLENMESFASAFLAKKISVANFFGEVFFFFLITSLGCDFKPLKHPSSPPKSKSPIIRLFSFSLQTFCPPRCLIRLAGI